MKGPGHRYDIDIRRLWECPECGKQVRLPANVAHRLCTCHNKQTWMRLVPKERIRAFPTREKIVLAEEFPEQEEEISAKADQPQSVSSETVQNVPEVSANESVAPEIVSEDMDSSESENSEPDSELGQTEQETSVQESIEQVEPIETVNENSQPSNQSTSEQSAEPRKKRRRKRNRKRDRKRKQSDSPPQNTDSGSINTQFPPETRSEDFGSGV